MPLKVIKIYKIIITIIKINNIIKTINVLIPQINYNIIKHTVNKDQNNSKNQPIQNLIPILKKINPPLNLSPLK
jgi:enterochelin esterase-like enzyme